MKKSVQDIKSKSIKELEKEVASVRNDITKITLESKVQPAKDTNSIKKKRHHLAVILSILQEKNYEEQMKLKNKFI